MSTAVILIVAVIFVTATNAAPLNKRCTELSNSTGPYDYCNKTTNTSQGDDGLDNLIRLANAVADTFVSICEKSENNKVSMCSWIIIAQRRELSNVLLCRFVNAKSLIIHTIWEQIEMSKMTASIAN